MSTSLTHLHNAHVAAFCLDDADWFESAGAPAAASHFRNKALAELQPVEVEMASGPVEVGQLDCQSSHSFGVSDAKHFCPPPAVNAEAQPGGSAEAGQGVGTSPVTLLEWAFDSYFSFLDNRDAGLRGLADRDKARCLRHLWAWMTEIQKLAGRS